MNTIGAYGVFQTNYKNQSIDSKDGNNAGRADKYQRTDSKRQDAWNGLSTKAKKLLKELQDKYKDMDFIVADYDSEEEASELLSRGNKDYGVLIDPEELEKMAADDKLKEKNMSMIEEAAGKLSDMKKQLGEDGKDIVRVGVAIDNNGNMSYFADLEKMGERQRERIEEKREEKRAEKAEAEKEERNRRYDFIGSEKNQSTRVKADSIEGLMDAIRNVDWSKVGIESVQQSGGRFDLSI